MKHSHYYKNVSDLKIIDFYRICDLYKINDACYQHALKKLLCVGIRGHKDTREDIQNIIDTMQRKLEMMDEDENESNIDIDESESNPKLSLP